MLLPFREAFQQTTVIISKQYNVHVHVLSTIIQGIYRTSKELLTNISLQLKPNLQLHDIHLQFLERLSPDKIARKSRFQLPTSLVRMCNS